jgi:hypothetical protein
MKSIRTLAAALALAIPAAAMAAGPIVIHRDPGCGCCEEWTKKVRTQFKRDVRMVDDSNRAQLKARLGVPAALSSCHTAIIDGMAFEGHVPIADMKRALATRPTGVKGLAVGGMPIGSPGMEVPGMKAQAYSVVAFGPNVQKVFARH